MNVNYIVKCRICGSLTRIRIPLGYIRNFPIRIHCGKCNSIIKGNMVVDNENISYHADFLNVDVISNGKPNYFSEVSGELPSNKVEDCLNKDWMDYADRMPGLNAIMQVGFENKEKLILRITNLSKEIEKWDDTKVIFNLLRNNNYEFIPKLLKEDIDIKEYPMNNDIEIHRAVHYTLLKFMKYIFIDKELNKCIIDINKEISIINIEEYNRLLLYLDKENYLEKAYNEILDMLFKFVDILPNLLPAISAMQYKSLNYTEQGISTCSFEDIKTFYIDAYEKILSYIHIPMCLDNIKYRNKYNEFDKQQTLEDFLKESKGNRLKKITEIEFFSSLIKFPIDNKLRNAIGHNQYEFNGITQIITYKPNEKKQEIIENKYLMKMAIECIQLMQYMVIIQDLIFQMIRKKNYNKGIKTRVNSIFYKKIGVNEKCPCR